MIFHNCLCLCSPNLYQNIEHNVTPASSLASLRGQPHPLSLLFRGFVWVFLLLEFHIDEITVPLLLCKTSFTLRVDLQSLFDSPAKWYAVISFALQVAELIWGIFTSRPVPCHSQSCQQCSHHHQCHLWWAGARDVLQTCGARARSTCAEPPVPGLWRQQRQPQRQVLLLLFGSTCGN